MPEGKYQIIVAVVGRSRPRGSAARGPWTRASRRGVVTVERAPGVARDAASRPEPAPVEPSAPSREDKLTATAERDARIYGLLETATARTVADMLGVPRNQILGASFRHRARNGLPPRVTPAALATASAADVADRHGVSVRSVRDVARTVRPAAPRRPLVPLVCAPIITASPGTRVALVDARAGQCRSIEADGLCCCAPTCSGSSWCPDHFAVYHRRQARAA